MCCLWDIQNSCQKWGAYNILMVFIWMCAYSNGHMMVTHILLDVTIWQLHGWLTHNILYPCLLCLLLPMMPIGMVFLVPFPLPLRFFLFVWPMLLGLHHILKLAIHIHRHLDHFYYVATSCVRFLLRNIGLLCSSPRNIMLTYCSGIHFIFLHVIFWCSISHSNIVFYIYHFHLSMIHSWIQIQAYRSFNRHFHISKTTFVMENC